MTNKSALAVFAKEPIQGFVKTRLAHSLLEEGRVSSIESGLKQSQSYFMEFLRQWNLKIQDLPHHDAYLFYSSQNEPEILRSLFTQIQDDRFIQQTPGDLGDKMKSCAIELSQLGYQKVMIIGTDSPDLPLEHLETGFKELNSNKVCVGPCEDGGYYTIGFNLSDHRQALHHILTNSFQDIKWSSAKVYQQTIANLRQTEILYQSLPLWYDIDSVDELDKYLSR